MPKKRAKTGSASSETEFLNMLRKDLPKMLVEEEKRELIMPEEHEDKGHVLSVYKRRKKLLIKVRKILNDQEMIEIEPLKLWDCMGMLEKAKDLSDSGEGWNSLHQLHRQSKINAVKCGRRINEEPKKSDQCRTESSEDSQRPLKRLRTDGESLATSGLFSHVKQSPANLSKQQTGESNHMQA